MALTAASRAIVPSNTDDGLFGPQADITGARVGASVGSGAGAGAGVDSGQEQPAAAPGTLVEVYGLVKLPALDGQQGSVVRFGQEEVTLDPWADLPQETPLTPAVEASTTETPPV